MAVYVQKNPPMKNGKITGILTADSTDELHIFASKIGACRGNYENNPPRYILAQVRITLAEKFGAIING